MNTESVLKVTDTEALHVVLCANAEVLGVDGDDRRAAVDAAILAAENAADKCFNPDTEAGFLAWRGGLYSQISLGYGDCWISLRRREIADYVVDEEVIDDWHYAAHETASPKAKALAQKIADAANAAFAKAKEEAAAKHEEE